MGISVHSWNSIIMKAFIFATLLAVATAVPLEDTAEVKAAKEAFMAAFAAAEAGDHAALAPVQGPLEYLADTEEVAAAKAAFAGHIPVQGAAAYLADLPEVAEAKAAFKATFDAYANGEIPLPVAPVHTIPAPVAVAAPVLAAPHYYNGYYGHPYAHAGYPYAHAGYAGYAGYYGHPYAHAGYAGYPFGLPVVAAAPAAEATE